MEEQYYDIERRSKVKETARELRRKYLRYKDAEIVYSMTHKKLLELAGRTGALYRIDGYVLIDRGQIWKCKNGYSYLIGIVYTSG